MKRQRPLALAMIAVATLLTGAIAHAQATAGDPGFDTFTRVCVNQVTSPYPTPGGYSRFFSIALSPDPNASLSTSMMVTLHAGP